MGIWDVVESAAGGIADLATDYGPVMRRAPGLGEAVSAAQAIYHAGSAGYDAVTGDRDGAVNHGTQALVNAVGVIPGVPESYGMLELAGAGAGTLLRGAAENNGHALGGIPTEELPGGIDDLAGSLAVLGTNAIFGADDSNWIAEGDRPTGTRSGEIGAGVAALGGVFGGIAPPIGNAAAAAGGWMLGNAIGDRTSPGEPTSGATPGFAAQLGQAIHDVATGEDLRDEERDARRAASRRELREHADRDRPRAPGDPLPPGRLDEMARSVPQPRAPTPTRRPAPTASRETQVNDLARRAGVPMERLMRMGPTGDWIYDEAAIAQAERTAVERGRS